MEVALTKDLEELIAEQVASGQYPSPGEVVRDALRLFQELLVLRERKLDALRRDVHTGLKALEEGEYEDYDADDTRSLAAEVKGSGRERLKALGKDPVDE
ncbi:MAG: type II toxin-antitoxin system ParD family antitoxin [Acidobacteria bacterium]|nr:type II toxin-antitoxin system ParD family antitoxin [Acidobacteriota bacterium]